jgi:2-haloacid dehalogenase
VGALDPHFERAFGSAAVRQQWFGQVLQLAFVGGLTGRYVDFTSAQKAAVAMLAERHGVEVDPDPIVAGMRTLPPHADVPEALDTLRAADLPLAAITNSPLDVVNEQLRTAGLADRFDAILSADQVQALKPRPEPYEFVARTFGIEVGDVRLVAAHGWDITGALAAGCKAAFVARPGQVLNPLAPRPDAVADDLAALARRIVELDA